MVVNCFMGSVLIGGNIYMMIEKRSDTDTVPIWEKMNLTVKEAAGYSNIGESTLREYIRKNPESIFFLYIGSKTLIKRKEFEEWNSLQYVVK